MEAPERDSLAGSTGAIRVFDTNSHVTEPPDLWTSRVPTKWGDDVPHVLTNPTTGVESWFIRDTAHGSITCGP
jgi:hypothetical protein